MTAKSQFVRLYWFIRKYPKLRIVVYRTTGKVRGRAHLYRRAVPRIELWLPVKPTARDWAKLVATLIHEYGHVALRYIPHTEREAWRWGLRGVPSEIVPACWPSFKRTCLKSYPRRLRDRRYVGAYGRAWKWVRK